jgi:hypothetical protein
MTTLQHTAPATTAVAPNIRRSLAAGALAAPLFTVVALAQAATRDGYDLTRHPISMLSNGDLGWIQIASFLACGVLTLAGVAGARRVLRGGPAAKWAPILLTCVGAGLLIAGSFRMDPGDGFPVGTPAGVPAAVSWHFVVHNVGGSLSFLSMIALCFVLARRFTADGLRAWAVTGRVSGVLFAVGLGWAMSGGTAGALTLFLGDVAAWLWIAASMAVLRRRAA